MIEGEQGLLQRGEKRRSILRSVECRVEQLVGCLGWGGYHSSFWRLVQPTVLWKLGSGDPQHEEQIMLLLSHLESQGTTPPSPPWKPEYSWGGHRLSTVWHCESGQSQSTARGVRGRGRLSCHLRFEKNHPW